MVSKKSPDASKKIQGWWGWLQVMAATNKDKIKKRKRKKNEKQKSKSKSKKSY